ncbi:MAG: M1 family metallopeptidase [Rhizomicrobium sp.]
MQHVRGLSLGLLVLLAGPVAAQAQSGAREVLPDTVVPLHYDLALVPDAAKLTFRGTVAITVQVNKPVRDITVNADGLTFAKASLDQTALALSAPDTKLGRETLHAPKSVTAGRHVLTIDYSGPITRNTLGFFAMDYQGANGPRRTLATNFEPTGARKLLPCWDEPARKATFTISVDAPKDQMAVSNMPVDQVTPLSGALQRVRFKQSPKMSTYLLFLGIGDYERVKQTVDGVESGVVVKRGDSGKAAYALVQAGKVLHYYNSYVGVKFPLPKLDLIAAPGEISGGSMENWGAIFYSQQHLLFDPKTSTESDRQLVFMVVAHEMAHQWFGDLVTMAWWDNLWLNEGFARWMQTYSADDLHPEWKTGLRALSIFEGGKEADAIPSTHPVIQNILTADQASQAFDQITYDKGAAVITMINAYVGREAFQKGVQAYMRAHAYSNTEDGDLWGEIQKAAGKPILEIEHDVTRQAGVPLIKVAFDKDATRLSEGRFAADPTTIAGIAPQSWLLPIAVQSLSGGNAQTALLKAPARFAVAPPALVNAGQQTYGRVLYPAGSAAALSAALPRLAAADQYGLLNDTAALGFAGYQSASDMLALIASLPQSADPIVWQRALTLLGDIDGHYADGAPKAAFRAFALKLLHPLAARLGLSAKPGEDGNIQILRMALDRLAGRFGDAGVIAWAKKTMDDAAANPIDRRAALDVAAASADAAAFDALLAKARAEKDPLAKQHMFEALAGVEDPALAKRMVEIAFGNDPPAGTTPSLLYELGANHPDLTWDGAVARLKDSKNPMEQTLRWEIAVALASGSALPARIAAVTDYEKSVPEAARRPFLGAIAAIRQNQHIREKAVPEISAWVAARPK